MSFGAQQSAKKAVASQMYRRGFAFADIPHYTGGILEGEGAVVVEDEHYLHDHIPSELDHDSGFEGLPVELE